MIETPYGLSYSRMTFIPKSQNYLREVQAEKNVKGLDLISRTLTEIFNKKVSKFRRFSK